MSDVFEKTEEIEFGDYELTVYIEGPCSSDDDSTFSIKRQFSNRTPDGVWDDGIFVSMSLRHVQTTYTEHNGLIFTKTRERTSSERITTIVGNGETVGGAVSDAKEKLMDDLQNKAERASENAELESAFDNCLETIDTDAIAELADEIVEVDE